MDVYFSMPKLSPAWIMKRGKKMDQRRAFMVSAGESRSQITGALGAELCLKVSGADTAGAWAMFEILWAGHLTTIWPRMSGSLSWRATTITVAVAR